MSVTSHHPDYSLHHDEWSLMRHAVLGEKAVKEAGEDYLPRPSGFSQQADGGEGAYAAYKKRARFPEITLPTISGMIGLIHGREFAIEGLEEGSALEYLWEYATPDGLTLEAFSQQITAEILTTGRYAVLVDPPSAEDEDRVAEDAGKPLLAGYAAETLINWDDQDFSLYVLDESRWVRGDDGFTWVRDERYRELRVSEDGEYQQVLHRLTPAPGGSGEAAAERGDPVTPTVTGGEALDEIPLVVVGPRTLAVPPEVPPLLGVARSALAAYQLDADYRHQLFWTGQETLVFSGMAPTEVPKVVGAGVAVALQDPQAKAEYVGPTGAGIKAHKEAIADAKADAVQAGARLFDTTDAPDESGRARKMRYVAQTATLRSVAIASAACLERALRWAAVFLGEDPESIVVKPNLEFVEAEMSAADAVQLMTLWQSGAISYETFYGNLQRGRIASEERTAEEEQELVDEETPDEAEPGGDLLEDEGGALAPGADRFVETGEGLEITEEDVEQGLSAN